MKKTSLLLVIMLLITGTGGAYGYFFIYETEEVEAIELDEIDETQETNDTVDEEPEDPPVENNDTLFRGMKKECFEHGGIERCWILYVPDLTDTTKSIPILLDLHGLQRNAYQQYNFTDMDRIARENNAIVLYPQGYGDSWNFGACCDPAKEENIDDMGFLETLIKDSLERFPVDTKRIYLTGWSNGCAMSQVLANKVSDLITAVACMSMYFIGEEASNYSPIPVMEIHGFFDEIAPYSSLVPSGIFFQQEIWNTGAIQNLYTWKEMNGCSGNNPDWNEEEIFYNIQGFTNCDNSSEVALVTIHAGTHNVYVNKDPGSPDPGTQGTVDTSQLAWDFLSRFSK